MNNPFLARIAFFIIAVLGIFTKNPPVHKKYGSGLALYSEHIKIHKATENTFVNSLECADFIFGIHYSI